jgi:hypothetical protein
MTRKPVVYHIIQEGRRQVSAASTLVLREGRIAVELDPRMVHASGVFVEIDPKKLRTLADDGYVFGYPELVDRRQMAARRRKHSTNPARGPGRRASDQGQRER